MEPPEVVCGAESEREAAAECEGEDEAVAAAQLAAAPLSKNAAKKLAKQAEWELRKGEKKAAKKAKEKEASAARHVVLKQRLEALSPEELQAHLAKRQSTLAERRESKAQAVAHRNSALDSPFNLCIDCAFGELMQPKEVKSLLHQFTLCYASNGRAAVPTRLTFAGLTGALAAGYDKYAGSERWPVVRSADSYLQLFAERRASLVYLTADSPNELSDLSEQDVYLIGGVVDRNRHKGLTLRKAEAEGIRHARLPLQQHMQLSGSAVLTVNQVLDILLVWLEVRDWRVACQRAVPPRKRGAEETGGAGTQKAQKLTLEPEPKPEPADDDEQAGDEEEAHEEAGIEVL